MLNASKQFLQASSLEVLMPYIGLALFLSNIVYYIYNHWV